MHRKKNLARGNDGVSEAGSGVPGGSGGANGHPTAAADSLGADDTVITDSGDTDSGEVEFHGDADIEDLTVHDADDPSLGLTNYGDVPPQDWAANTGPTHTGEERSKGVDRKLEHDDEKPGGRKIEF